MGNMSLKKDLTGMKINRLTVLGLKETKNGKNYWNCECECGNKCVVRQDHLLRKERPTKSCGCLNKENAKKLAEMDLGKRFESTHGDSNTRFYKIFDGIKSRCLRKSHPHYDRYGGRGIKCEWKSYEEFKKDMYESYCKHVELYGEKNTTIDRIDVNGNYCKDNCKWSTPREQSFNRENTVYIVMEDNSLEPLAKFAYENNISYNKLNKRYNNSEYKKTGKIPYNELIKEKDIVSSHKKL